MCLYVWLCWAIQRCSRYHNQRLSSACPQYILICAVAHYWRDMCSLSTRHLCRNHINCRSCHMEHTSHSMNDTQAIPHNSSSSCYSWKTVYTRAMRLVTRIFCRRLLGAASSVRSHRRLGHSSLDALPECCSYSSHAFRYTCRQR
jgi:hypothetical protein